jgi:hypothetical protein
MKTTYPFPNKPLDYALASRIDWRWSRQVTVTSEYR